MNSNLLAKDIMNKNVLTLSEELFIANAIELFIDNAVCGAPVVNMKGQLVGFLSTHDLMVDLWCEDYEINEALKIKDLMSKKSFSIDVNEPFTDIIEKLSIDKDQLYPSSVQGFGTYSKMTAMSVEQRAKAIYISKPQILPVVENDILVGVISRMEVLKTMRTFYNAKLNTLETFKELEMA